MTAPQLLHGLTHDQYAALPGWRWSHIKLLHNGSARHVKHALTTKDDDTAARTMLRAIHSLVLEPDNFEASFSVYEGRRDARTWDYQQHLALYPGTSVLNDRELELATSTARAVREHPEVAKLFEDGESEVTITWTDAETGLPCKARIDRLGSALADLKTLGTTNERDVSRLVVKNLYHGQLAHYDEAAIAVGMPNLPVRIICAEGKNAQDTAVFKLDRGIPDGALHIGRELRRGLMRQLAEIVAKNEWPGRHPVAVDLILPAYVLLEQGEIDFEERGLSQEDQIP